MDTEMQTSEFFWLDEDVVEVALVLPVGYARALVEAASNAQISSGQLLRLLIGEYLSGLGQPA